MQSGVNPSPNIEIRGGQSHLDLSSPCFGFIIVVYSLNSKTLHLLGNLAKDAAQYVPQQSQSILDEYTSSPNSTFLVRHGDWRDETDRLHAAISYAIDMREVEEALNAEFGGHGHATINYRENIQDGIPIGGALAYYDGTTLFIDGASGDYGRISRVALKTCLVDVRVPCSFGRYILGDEHPAMSDKCKCIIFNSLRNA